MTRNIDVRYLLDVNVLLGLAFSNHSLHAKAHRWFSREPNRLWASCSLTQAGFLRAGSHMLGRTRESIPYLLSVWERVHAVAQHEFWEVDVDLTDLSIGRRSHLIGANQITDLQLLMLAHRHRGRLATFDRGIVELAKVMKYSESLVFLD